MLKIKAYLWAATAAVVAGLLFLLLGKSRKLEQLRVQLKIKEIDSHLEALSHKADEARKEAEDAEKAMVHKLNDYRPDKWKPGDSGPPDAA